MRGSRTLSIGHGSTSRPQWSYLQVSWTFNVRNSPFLIASNSASQVPSISLTEALSGERVYALINATELVAKCKEIIQGSPPEEGKKPREKAVGDERWKVSKIKWPILYSQKDRLTEIRRGHTLRIRVTQIVRKGTHLLEPPSCGGVKQGRSSPHFRGGHG